MANILINNYCNLKCSYCFADEVICQPKYNITSEQLAKILTYFEYECCQVALIGGEPTLHPHFMEIYQQYMEHIRKWHGASKLFTNGICLGQYAADLDSQTSILVNVNADDKVAYTKMVDSLNILTTTRGLNSMRLGCNVSPDRENYDFVWDLVKEFKQNAIRYAVVMPGGKLRQWLSDKDVYYRKMVPIFLQFCEDAIKLECQLLPDCAQIPVCYFTEKELELVYMAAPGYNRRTCGFVCDIEPDGTVSWCFGSGVKANLFDYKDIDDVAMDMCDNFVTAKRQRNFMDKCTGCKYKGRQCSSGCLGFNRG